MWLGQQMNNRACEAIRAFLFVHINFHVQNMQTQLQLFLAILALSIIISMGRSHMILECGTSLYSLFTATPFIPYKYKRDKF